VEPDTPYLWAECDDSSRLGGPKRRIIWRKCDNSKAGYLLQVDGGWEIEEPIDRPRPTRHTLEQPKPLVFPDFHDAALFLYMRNRAYTYPTTTKVPPERIEIRVSPSFDFGEFSTCLRGQWIAFLYRDDGTPAGRYCGDSIEEAKFQGLKMAHFRNPLPTEEMRQISQQQWKTMTITE
jgi:hypothetical protein